MGISRILQYNLPFAFYHLPTRNVCIASVELASGTYIQHTPYVARFSLWFSPEKVEGIQNERNFEAYLDMNKIQNSSLPFFWILA
jgi:hypothetical protein